MMRQTITQEDDRAGNIMALALGMPVAPPHVGLVVRDGPHMAAIVVLNNFDRVNVDLSMVVFQRLQMAAIRDLAAYVFGRLGVKRVSILTRASNHCAIDRAVKLGFQLEGVLRARFPGPEDGLLLGLLASEQRFVRLGHG